MNTMRCSSISACPAYGMAKKYSDYDHFYMPIIFEHYLKMQEENSI